MSRKKKLRQEKSSPIRTVKVDNSLPWLFAGTMVVSPSRGMEPRPLAARALVGFGRNTIFHPRCQYSDAAKMVCEYRPSGGERSVFPLCGQQPRQHVGLTGVSHDH